MVAVKVTALLRIEGLKLDATDTVGEAAAMTKSLQALIELK
jgi:hypothetical protein